MINILAISGSLRAASTNTSLLRAAAELAPAGVVIDLYEGLGQLPLFNPDLDVAMLPAVLTWQRAVAQAHAIDQVTLTASGGPFREWPQERMAQATPEQAVAHPNWSMGAKISVDSATLMNKGLELIEARRSRCQCRAAASIGPASRPIPRWRWRCGRQSLRWCAR